jgi:hypothetical protein
MPVRRGHHFAPGSEKDIPQYALPIVMIRDPYHFLQSCCKQPYAMSWRYSHKFHCPNLIPSDFEFSRWPNLFVKPSSTTEKLKPIPVTINFDKNDTEHFSSLIDVWNVWYNQYVVDADYPRLIVRFEDLLLRPQEVMSKIATCLGGSILPPGDFKYQLSSSKSHGSGTDYVKAIEKTGSIALRTRNMTLDDIEFLREHTDGNLSRIFSYRLP